jgi:hypothetical protein
VFPHSAAALLKKYPKVTALRPSDVTRAIKAVTNAGLSISAVRINAQGQIKVETAPSDGQDSTSDLDCWMASRIAANHARSH